MTLPEQHAESVRSALDPALLACFWNEVARVGVDLDEFAAGLRALGSSHGSGATDATDATSRSIGMDVTHLINHLQRLPDGAGTPALLALLRAGFA